MTDASVLSDGAAHDIVDDATGWRVTGTSLACLIIGPSAVLVACFGVLLAPTAAHYGWTRAQIGGAASAMTAAIMVASILQGALVDRFGVRRVVLLSIPLFASALFLLRWLPGNLALFYLAWFALPISAVGLWPASYLKAVSGWFDRHLGMATGVTNAGIGLGTIAVPALVAAVASGYGLRAAFMAMAAAAIVAWPIAFFGLRERRTAQGRRADGGTWTFAQIIADARYRIVLVSFLLLGVTGTALVASIVPILTSKGLSPRMAVSAFAAFGLMSLAGRLVSGWLLDRMHVARVLNLLGGTTLLGLLAIIGLDQAPVLIAAAALLGLMSGGEFDVLAYTLRRYFGLASFGRRYGLAFSAFQLGATGGGALLAASIAWTDTYAPALAGFAAAVSGSMILFSRIGPYPERKAA